MNLTFTQVTEKTTWEGLVQSFPEANFLQSWNWGVFHQNLGKTVLRYQAEDQGQVVAVFQLVKEEAKRGTYLALPGGPLMDWTNHQLVEAVFSQLQDIGQAEQAVFIRFRPQELSSPALIQLVEEQGTVPSPMHLTADLTLQLDLSQSSDELLAGMRKNTRYEVRKADKLGIRVEKSQDIADIDRMYQDQLYLAEKHGFVPFSQDFWTKQFEALVADDQVMLFHSYLDDQLLASAFIIFYNGEAVYHYGTSTEANNRLPGSYATQWAAIQEAQDRGCHHYNFWGIAPKEQTDHRFAGVSIFKRGWGGDEVEYLPAHDLPLSNAYQLTRGFEWVRKKIRRL